MYDWFLVYDLENNLVGVTDGANELHARNQASDIDLRSDKVKVEKIDLDSVIPAE